MLENSGAELLVTQSSLDWKNGHNSSSGSYRKLLLEEISDRLTKYADANLTEEISPRSLAYILHTSGSTGTPKGSLRFACRPWRSICSRSGRFISSNRKTECCTSTVLRSTPRWKSCSPRGAWEQRWCCRGEELWTPDKFWEIVQDQSLTVLDLPPTYFRPCNEIIGTQWRNSLVPPAVDYRRGCISRRDPQHVERFRRADSQCLRADRSGHHGHGL